MYILSGKLFPGGFIQIIFTSSPTLPTTLLPLHHPPALTLETRQQGLRTIAFGFVAQIWVCLCGGVSVAVVVGSGGSAFT